MKDLNTNLKFFDFGDALDLFSTRLKQNYMIENIDNSKPAILSFAVSKVSDDKFEGVLTFDMPNTMINDYSNFESPFFESNRYNVDVDLKVWNIYHNQIAKKSSNFYRGLISILKEVELQELYVASNHYNTNEVDIISISEIPSMNQLRRNISNEKINVASSED